MLTIKNENIKPFDCDGTLVEHVPLDKIAPGESLDVYDYVTKSFIRVRINKPMVRLLREEKARGAYIIVWSRGGYRWASDVIKALDLVDYVDICLSKPLAYFDDSEVSTWMKDRVFIESNVPYKLTLTKEKRKNGF